jgi:type III secretion protein J
VHLVVPERHPLMDKPQPAAASVFIKHRPDKDLRPQLTQIKALVVNSLEGLSYDHVTVALFPAEGMAAEAPRVMTAAGAEARQAMLQVPLLRGGTGGGAVLLAGALLWWRRRGQTRRPMAVPLRALPAPDTELTRPLPADFQAALRRQSTPVK